MTFPNTYTTYLTLALPSGRYVVHSTVFLDNPNPTTVPVTCKLASGPMSSVLASSILESNAGNASAATLPITWAVDLTPIGGSVALQCQSSTPAGGALAEANQGEITAISVTSITVQVPPPPPPPTSLPSQVTTVTATNLREIRVGFAQPMTQNGAASALDPWHYTLTGGLAIDGVRLVGPQIYAVTVGTSTANAYDSNHLSADPATYMAQGGSYSLTVQNIATASGIMTHGSTTPFVAADTLAPTVSTPTVTGAYTFYVTFSEPMNPVTTNNSLLWDGVQLCGTTTPSTNTTPDCNGLTQGGTANLHWQDRTIDPCGAGTLGGGCFQTLRVDFIAAGRPAASGNHTLSVGGTDAAGNALLPNPTTRNFTLPGFGDTTPPAVTSADIQLFGNGFRVRVNYNESMAHSRNGYSAIDSIDNAANYALQNLDGSPATTGDVSGVGSPITFSVQPSSGSDAQQSTFNTSRYLLQQARLVLSPIGSNNGSGGTTTPTLHPGTAYRVVISNVKDEAGNALPTTTMTFSWPGDTLAPQAVRAFATSNTLMVDYSESMVSSVGFVPASGFTPGGFWPDPSCTNACDRSRYSSPNVAFNSWLQAMITPNPGTGAGTEPPSFDNTGANFTNTTAMAPGTYELDIAGVNDPFGNVMTPTVIMVTVVGPP